MRGMKLNWGLTIAWTGIVIGIVVFWTLIYYMAMNIPEVKP